jgi:hypothetical protein
MKKPQTVVRYCEDYYTCDRHVVEECAECHKLAKKAVSRETARGVMGRNVLDIDEWTWYPRVRLSGTELKVLEEVPFAEAVLEACKDTHILVGVSSAKKPA